jgi:ATP-dependent RNA helicase HelY
LDDDGTTVTPLGQTQRGHYTERDLLAAECLRTGVWKRLDAPALAAVVSTLVHEPRAGEADPSPRMPTEAVGEAVEAMQRLWDGLEALEHDAGLSSPAMPDGGLAWAMHRWASGRALEEVLRGQDMAAGDFVRRCKQVVDLLGQIAEAAPEPEVRRSARAAMDGVLRGVVALDRLD